MKKLLVIISLLLVCTLMFSACKNEEQQPTELPPENSSDVYISSEVILDDEIPYDNGTESSTFASIDDLTRFFIIESVESKGIEYYQLFHMALRDNFVFKPLLNGVDVTTIPQHASIEIKPIMLDNKFPHIAYYYTDGTYNAIIKVYYLTDEQLNVANIGGIYALNDGDEEVVTREKYGKYTIVNYLPEETNYAEFFMENKYYITIEGGVSTNDRYRDTIDKTLLDMISFETVPVAIEQFG